MTTFDHLSDSLIVDILTCGVLSPIDVLNFSTTCHRFYRVCGANSVWKHFCQTIWPCLMRKEGRFMNVIQHLKITTETGIRHDEVTTTTLKWNVLFKQIHNIFAALKSILRDHFVEDEQDDAAFEIFDDLINQYTYEFIAAVLHELIVTKCQITANLTDKYYAKRAYRILKQKWLTPQLVDLLQAEEAPSSANPLVQRSVLLQGIILIEQWFNLLEEGCSSEIDQFVEDAAKKTIQHYKSSFVEPKDCSHSQILQKKVESLNHVFFNDLKFSGNKDDYFNSKNSFIHSVIESRKGIPILLSIIYREIASRVGLTLECVNNPGHFVLRYQVDILESTKPTITDIPRAYRYVDVFNEGRILEFNELPKVSLRVAPATISEVFHRVSLNVDAHTRISDQINFSARTSLDSINLCLLCDPQSHRVADVDDSVCDLFFLDKSEFVNVLKTLCMVFLQKPTRLQQPHRWPGNRKLPTEDKVRARRIQLYFDQGFNLSTMLEDNRAIPDQVRLDLSMRPSEVMEETILERIKIKKLEMEKQSKLVVSLRSNRVNKDVLYSVGMVMRHRRYNYVCVIRGWDNICKMPEQWKRQMGIYSLQNGADQSYYHVLVHMDGSQRYAAQENLEPVCQQEEVDHPEVGRYFASTSDHPFRHYLPNTELAARFPEDVAVASARFDHNDQL